MFDVFGLDVILIPLCLRVLVVLDCFGFCFGVWFIVVSTYFCACCYAVVGGFRFCVWVYL